eukprot:TRINITY_DN70549_c0_g1_i1.p1 TRINITY_DN70549_c0_g1~~TRINITY_DN70549_c0_g1_i1.p1  ORF type:complete len:644 (+),score=69.05 TRINITY_DN70549_c0_g1_i1:176-2107(+)
MRVAHSSQVQEWRLKAAPLAIVHDAKEFLLHGGRESANDASFLASPVAPVPVDSKRCFRVDRPRHLLDDAEALLAQRRPLPLATVGNFTVGRSSSSQSAPPTRSYVGNEVLTPLSMPSPPKTDPPRRRRTRACVTLADEPHFPSPRSDNFLAPALGISGNIAPAAIAPSQVQLESCLGLKSIPLGGIVPTSPQVRASQPDSNEENWRRGRCLQLNTAVAIGDVPASGTDRRHETVASEPSSDDGSIVPAGQIAGCSTYVQSSSGKSTVHDAKESAGLSPSLMRMRSDWDDCEAASQPGELSLRDHSSELMIGLDANNPRAVSSIESTPLASSNSEEQARVYHNTTTQCLMSALDEALPVAMKGGLISWSRGELIGRGSLGIVWKALDRRTGKLMAVKEIHLDGRDKSDDRLRSSLQNEVDLYKDFEHPNIVSYLGNDYTNGRLYIYLEFMAGGSLAQVLSQFGPLDEPLVARYTRQVLLGLEYLHTRDPCVLHRDIKGANILVGLDRTVKLSDFGCSKRSHGTDAHTMRGSILWMAPEVMQQSVYGRKADIWSVGCVIIEMCTGTPPWGSFDNCFAAMVRIAMSNETPQLPSHLSDQGREFASRCLCRSPGERADASCLLAHPFIAGNLGDFDGDDSSIDARP